MRSQSVPILVCPYDGIIRGLGLLTRGDGLGEPWHHPPNLVLISALQDLIGGLPLKVTIADARKLQVIITHPSNPTATFQPNTPRAFFSHAFTIDMRTSAFLPLLSLLPASFAAPIPVAVPVTLGPLPRQNGISFIDCSECRYGYTALPDGAYVCLTNVQVYCDP